MLNIFFKGAITMRNRPISRRNFLSISAMAAAAVAVEHGAQTRPPAQLGGLALALNRGYGDTALSLFTCDANQADELEG